MWLFASASVCMCEGHGEHKQHHTSACEGASAVPVVSSQATAVLSTKFSLASDCGNVYINLHLSCKPSVLRPGAWCQPPLAAPPVDCPHPAVDTGAAATLCGAVFCKCTSGARVQCTRSFGPRVAQ
jgi:hypothetical protein